MILFFARFSLPSVSVPPFLTEQLRTRARSSPAKPQWAIGEAMRLECDARSASRIYLVLVQMFSQLTGRVSSIVLRTRSLRSRRVLRLNCTPADFAIRDFC